MNTTEYRIQCTFSQKYNFDVWNENNTKMKAYAELLNYVFIFDLNLKKNQYNRK